MQGTSCVYHMYNCKAAVAGAQPALKPKKKPPLRPHPPGPPAALSRLAPTWATQTSPHSWAKWQKPAKKLDSRDSWNWPIKVSKSNLWSLQFSQKTNEILSAFCSFFWRIEETINCFRDYLTFSTYWLFDKFWI